MLRNFTIQPAAGGSPAGKAYTHQFPKHVFFYLGIFFSSSMSYFSTVKLGAGSRLDMDHFMMTYYHQFGAISQNIQRNPPAESDDTAFEEKLSTQSR